MKKLNRILFALLAVFSSFVTAEKKVEYNVKSIPAQDGVFYLSNGYQKTIVELKNGSFRYWMSSDVMSGEKTQYPIKGKYKLENDSVLLISDHNLGSHSKWFFRKINTTVTIWTDFAVEEYSKSKELHSYGILRFTDKSAEYIWPIPFYSEGK